MVSASSLGKIALDYFQIGKRTNYIFLLIQVQVQAAYIKILWSNTNILSQQNPALNHQTFLGEQSMSYNASRQRANTFILSGGAIYLLNGGC